MENKKSMPERLKEKLATSRRYFTTDLRVVSYLSANLIQPYLMDDYKKNPKFKIFFYENTQKLRDVLEEYYQIKK